MRSIVIGVAALLFATTAHAGYPVEEKVECPIGGEKFSHTTTASYSIFGRRPDGFPYGSWVFPLDLPVCPTNRLVVFDDFTDEEKASLARLIASADFKNLEGAGETTYYRAAWLSQQLHRPVTQSAWLLTQAGW